MMIFSYIKIALRPQLPDPIHTIVHSFKHEQWTEESHLHMSETYPDLCVSFCLRCKIEIETEKKVHHSLLSCKPMWVTDVPSNQINWINLCFFSCTGFVLVLNKPSAVAPVSLKALMKAWSSSPLATSRPRPVFTRLVGWRPPCLLSSRLEMTWSSPRSRQPQAKGLLGLQSVPGHIVPPWT